jgi:hypothetical protein
VVVVILAPGGDHVRAEPMAWCASLAESVFGLVAAVSSPAVRASASAAVPGPGSVLGHRGTLDGHATRSLR